MSHFPILQARQDSDLASDKWIDFSLRDGMPHFQRLDYSLRLLDMEEIAELKKTFFLWKKNLSPYVLADSLVAHLEKQGCSISGGEIKTIGLHGIDLAEWLAWRDHQKFSIAEIQSYIHRSGEAIHAIALPKECLESAKLVQKRLNANSTVWDFLAALVSLESSRLSSLALRVRT